MKTRSSVYTLTITLLLYSFLQSAVYAGDEKVPVLVTTAWLAEHLNDPNLVILHVAQTARDYRRGHVPGARFVWVTSFAASTPELSFQLLPVEQLDTLFEGLGISNSSRIILCGVNGNVSPTARAYITLEYLGLGKQTSILDGGFDVWKTEGRTVSTESPMYQRGTITPHIERDAIVDADYVKGRLHTEGITILDARAPQFFQGNGGGFPRAGHIPGARNVYFSTLFDSTNKYLPLDSLKAKFDAAGIKSGDEIVTYCHVGQTASSDYIAAKLLGHVVHLYDGSFEDWSGRDDFPIELPK